MINSSTRLSGWWPVMCSVIQSLFIIKTDYFTTRWSNDLKIIFGTCKNVADAQECKLCGLTELNHQSFYPSVLLLSVKYCFPLAFFVREEIMLCVKHTIRKF